MLEDRGQRGGEGEGLGLGEEGLERGASLSLGLVKAGR